MISSVIFIPLHFKIQLFLFHLKSYISTWNKHQSKIYELLPASVLGCSLPFLSGCWESYLPKSIFQQILLGSHFLSITLLLFYITFNFFSEKTVMHSSLHNCCCFLERLYYLSVCDTDGRSIVRTFHIVTCICTK